MYSIQMKRIINSYMRLMRELNHGGRMLTSHTILAHPLSLLPYQKELIQDALIKAIDNARMKHDRIQLHQLEQGLIFLQSFTEDERAAKHNESVLNNKSYWTDSEMVARIELNKR